MVGDPYWFPHPVRLIGIYIKTFEKAARKFTKSDFGLRIAGALLTISTVGFSYLIPYWILKLSNGYSIYLYYGINILLLYTCLAAKCLGAEAMKIYKQLHAGALANARKLTSWIVGRDTENLDEIQVTRAVVETVAENASDGIIAPLFYIMLGGAPLALAYKAANTLDSMVGYKNDRYLYFGWASARFDDLLNFIPARVSAFVISLAALFLGMNFKESIITALKDGQNHSSPNSGFPEAAAAGALGVKLGGTNYYFGKPECKPTIGQALKSLDKEDILKMVRLMYAAYFLTVSIFGLIYFVSRW
jgi:adenosylcobinamide-phosphate synthase